MVRSCDKPGRALAALLGACACLALTLWASDATAAPELSCCTTETVSPTPALCSLPPAAASGLPAVDPCRDEVDDDEGRAPDEGADDEQPLAVPICLIEGASGIAPPLVHPIANCRIELVHDRGSDGQLPRLLRPQGSDDSSVKTSDHHAAATAPQAAALSSPAALILELPRRRPEGRHDPGHASRVYRPPRR